MSHIIGNFSTGFKPGNKIFGVNSQRSMTAGTPVTIVGNAGDVVYFNAQALFSVRLDQGTCIQCTAGSAKVSFTLQDPKLATNPDMQNQISWANEQTLSPGKIVWLQDTPFFNAMKVVFEADGVVIVSAR